MALATDIRPMMGESYGFSLLYSFFLMGRNWVNLTNLSGRASVVVSLVVSGERTVGTRQGIG